MKTATQLLANFIADAKRVASAHAAISASFVAYMLSEVGRAWGERKPTKKQRDASKAARTVLRDALMGAGWAEGTAKECISRLCKECGYALRVHAGNGDDEADKIPAWAAKEAAELLKLHKFSTSEIRDLILALDAACDACDAADAVEAAA